MADNARLIKQWLETDAALGAADVPIARRKRPKAGAAAAPTSSAAPAPAAHAAARDYAQQLRRAAPPPVRPVTPSPVAPPRQPPATAGQKPAPAHRAVVRPAAGPATKPSRAAVAIPAPPAALISSLPPLSPDQKITQLAELEQTTARALQSQLNEISTRVVFGEGNPSAELMFIGEGPGTQEDQTGRPFVGASGQKLNDQIRAMNFTREDVYIANIVKLRAATWDDAAGRPRDRPPTPQEVADQIDILYQQIAIIRPRVIITLGAPAIRYLCNEMQGVMKIRGHWHDFRGIPVMPTYHPAFLLRAYTLENRNKVWSDLQAVMKRLEDLRQ